MPRLSAYIVSLLVAINAAALVNVTGIVIDRDNKEQLTVASTIVKFESKLQLQG